LQRSYKNDGRASTTPSTRNTSRSMLLLFRDTRTEAGLPNGTEKKSTFEWTPTLTPLHLAMWPPCDLVQTQILRHARRERARESEMLLLLSPSITSFRVMQWQFCELGRGSSSSYYTTRPGRPCSLCIKEHMRPKKWWLQTVAARTRLPNDQDIYLFIFS
jgi:hypothetical protein